MAFSIGIIQGERCDKCNSLEGDLLLIRQSRKGERNYIFVHERCLTKAVESAKKKAAKSEPVEAQARHPA